MPCSARRRRAPTRSRARTPAGSPSSTAAASVAAMPELAEIEELVGRAGTYAAPRLLDRHRRPRRRRPAAAGPGERDRDRDQLLFFHLEWAALDDAQARGAAGERRPGLRCRHHLRTARRYRPHLLSEPEERILTEKTMSGRSALEPALRGADLRDRRVDMPDRTSRSRSTSRSRRLSDADREVQPTDRRSGSPRPSSPACAPAPTSSTPCWPTRRPTTGCAATRSGSQRATSPTRRPTSPCRRWSDAVSAATSSRSAGTA